MASISTGNCKDCSNKKVILRGGMLVNADKAKPIPAPTITKPEPSYTKEEPAGQTLLFKEYKRPDVPAQAPVVVDIQTTLPKVGHFTLSRSKPECPVEEVEEIEEEELCDEKYGKLEPVKKVAHSHKPMSLDWLWKCAEPVTKMIILGRVGMTLARFCKEGYLKVNKDGSAEVVDNIELCLTELLHSYNKPDIHTSTLLGDPLPSNFYAVASLNPDGKKAKVYLQQGLSDEPSLPLWNNELERVVHTPISNFPVTFRNNITEVECGEILATEVIGVNGDYEDPRSIKRLATTGLLYGEEVPSAPNNNCLGQQGTTVKYKGLQFPQGCGTLSYDDGQPVWLTTADLLEKLTEEEAKQFVSRLELVPVKGDSYFECWKQETGLVSATKQQMIDWHIQSAPRPACNTCDGSTQNGGVSGSDSELRLALTSLQQEVEANKTIIAQLQNEVAELQNSNG